MTNKEKEQHYHAIAETANYYCGLINLFRRDDRHRIWLEIAGLIETAQIKKYDQ